MQRRIEQTHRHRTIADDLVHLIEIFFQHRTNFIQRLLAGFVVIGEDHFTHNIDTVAFKEHMLSTAETDAFRTELNRLFGIARRIGVGANFHALDLIDPAHEFAKVTGQRRRFGLQLAGINGTGGAIERQRIFCREDLAVDGECLGIIVDAQIMSTGNAALTHTASNNGCMGGHAATSGDNTLCRNHTAEIFR